MNFDPLNPQWWLELGQAVVEHWSYVTSSVFALLVASRLMVGRAVEKGTGLIADICRSLRASPDAWRFLTDSDGKADQSVLVQDGTGYRVWLKPDGTAVMLIPDRSSLSGRERKALAAALESALARKMVTATAAQGGEVTEDELLLMVRKAVADGIIESYYGRPAAKADSSMAGMDRAELDRIRAEFMQTTMGRAAGQMVGGVGGVSSSNAPVSQQKPPAKKS